MLTAIKSANGFALAAAAAAATLCALHFTPLPLSPPTLTPPHCVSHLRVQLHCNPWQRRGPKSRNGAQKLQNGCHGGMWQCAAGLPFTLPPFFLPLPPTLLLAPLFAVPAQKDVRSILWFCKRLSHRILFALHIGHTPRPPCALLLLPLLSLATFRSPAWRWLPPAAPSTCVALQHN